MSDPTPRFAEAAAGRIAREFFGIDPTAAPLPSERDQNFVLTVPGGEQHVLKIAKADEERAVLEAQNAALRHVAARLPALAVPRLVSARDGSDIVVVHDDAGRPFMARLVTWLEGEPLVNVTPRAAGLLASLGHALASLNAALADFAHPALHRELQWDLRHAGRALRHLPLLSGEERSIVEHLRPAWERLDWDGLRTGVIHNDANDHNVLVRDGRVAGFLDFGDMVHSAIVCDPAIAVAYAMLDEPDPLAAAATIVTAYHERFPLAPAELDALYPLALSRLCMSVCYAAHNTRAKPGDPYQLVTAGPAWRLLRRLAEIPASAARDRILPRAAR